MEHMSPLQVKYALLPRIFDDDRMTSSVSLTRESIKSSSPSKNRLKYAPPAFFPLYYILILMQTNEMTWSHSGDLFLLTNGSGSVKILSWPSLDVLHTLYAHTSNCFSLEFDPRGRWVPICSTADSPRYLAIGGADAIVSLWDLKEWICIRTFDRQEYNCMLLFCWHL